MEVKLHVMWRTVLPIDAKIWMLEGILYRHEGYTALSIVDQRREGRIDGCFDTKRLGRALRVCRTAQILEQGRRRKM